MKRNMEQLAHLLTSLLDCCSKMLQLSVSEREALIENDMVKLADTCDKMTEYAVQLAQLEEKRLALHIEVTDKLNLPADASLREVLAGIGEREFFDGQGDLLNRIENTANSLSETYKELKKQTEANQRMVKQAVAYINKFMEVLSPDHKLTYRKGGEIYQSRMYSPFVNQTV